MRQVRATLAITRALRSASEAALQAAIVSPATPTAENATWGLGAALSRVWGQSIRKGIRDTSRAIGELKSEDEDIWQMFVDEYVRLYGGQAITNILETTRAQIMTRIEEGLRRGEPIDAIAKAIRGDIPAMSRIRAATIARTETHSAAQYAAIRTAQRSPHPLLKTWQSTVDHRTRDFGEGDGKVDQANHRVMRGVTVPLDQPFQVPNKFGGHDLMQFPGDQNAPAYQCVNCRCALTFKRAVRWSF